MDKFAKRLQSRLSAKGYRFNKEQCRQALVSTAANPELPTDDEMSAAFNWLTSEPTSGEVIIEPETEAIVPAPETNLDISAQDLPSQPTALEKSEPEVGAIAPTSSNQISQPITGGITQTEMTQAISQAVAEVGAAGNSEAIELLTSLANELSSDIQDVQEMVSSLITAYLGKRQNVLASAIGTVQSLRSAQTNSFQAGLNQDFFEKKDRSKSQFLKTLEQMFN